MTTIPDHGAGNQDWMFTGQSHFIFSVRTLRIGWSQFDLVYKEVGEFTASLRSEFPNGDLVPPRMDCHFTQIKPFGVIGPEMTLYLFFSQFDNDRLVHMVTRAVQHHSGSDRC